LSHKIFLFIKKFLLNKIFLYHSFIPIVMPIPTPINQEYCSHEGHTPRLTRELNALIYTWQFLIGWNIDEDQISVALYRESKKWKQWVCVLCILNWVGLGPSIIRSILSTHFQSSQFDSTKNIFSIWCLMFCSISLFISFFFSACYWYKIFTVILFSID
jgi:hypothetical protein